MIARIVPFPKMTKVMAFVDGGTAPKGSATVALTTSLPEDLHRSNGADQLVHHFQELRNWLE